METGKSKPSRNRLWFFLIILSLAGFVTSFGAHIIAINLPTYAKEVGTGFLGVGVLIALYDLAEVFAKPVFGFIADRKGMKATMIAGLLLFSVASLLFIFIDPWLLFAIRLLQGMGAAAFSVASMAMVAEYFRDDLAGPMGIYNAIKGLGYVIGPVVGGAIVFYADFASLFVACFIVGIAVTGFALFTRETGKGDFDNDDEDLKRLLTSFGDRKYLPWYLLTTVNMMFMGILFGFLPVYLNTSGFSPMNIGLIMAAVAVAFLAVQPASGRIAKVAGFRTTIYAGIVAEALFLIAIPFTGGWSTVLVAMADAAGIGIVWTLSSVAVAKAAEGREIGLALGNLGSYKEIGDMAGPLAIGLVSQLVSLTAGFVFCGLLGLIMLAPMLAVSQKNKTSAAVIVQRQK